MEVDGNCTAETSAAFLRQLRAHHTGALIVIWDNGPAHRGEALRTYLAPPDLNLHLHDGATSELLGGDAGFGTGSRDDAARRGDPVRAEQVLAMVLVEIHVSQSEPVTFRRVAHGATPRSRWWARPA